MRRHQASLTPLECKALWLLAEHGASHPPPAIQRDRELREAGERAIKKIWRQHMRMGKRHQWLWFWPFGRRREVQTSAKPNILE